ncbi:hypothetical protein K503DRAFT_788261, partial [Rhizopogon vinicolor AM-OR11-026]
MLLCLPSVSVTDADCNIIAIMLIWISFFVNTMLGVIMIARLHAMYQRSRRMLIFLVVIFMTVMITFVVMNIIRSSDASAGWSVRDCFKVLFTSHVYYFAAFATASCLNMVSLSSSISNSSSVGVQ